MGCYIEVFQYLYARRPILGLLPYGGEAAKIIRDNNAGEVVSPTEIEAIASKIEEMHRKFRQGKLISQVKMSGIEKYERRRQSGELAGILNKFTTNVDRG